jgi:hypothetical protein
MLRDIWWKALTASFGPNISQELTRSDTSMKATFQQIVNVIKRNMASRIKNDSQGVLCLQSDDSNKLGDDKTILSLSYATSLGRVSRDVVGAFSSSSKKAKQACDYVIKKALDEFDSSGDIIKMLSDHGSGTADHAPAAIKLMTLLIVYFYGCDAHSCDLVYKTVSELMVGCAEGLGSLRTPQFLYELGYTARSSRPLWEHIMEKAFGSMEAAPKCVQKLIRLPCEARWGSTAKVAGQFLVLASEQAPPPMIAFALQKLPGITPQKLADMVTVKGKYTTHDLLLLLSL